MKSNSQSKMDAQSQHLPELMNAETLDYSLGFGTL
jgi:hypothetical protein